MIPTNNGLLNKKPSTRNAKAEDLRESEPYTAGSACDENSHGITPGIIPCLVGPLI